MSNPLQMIPPAIRRYLYLALFLAGVVLGALQLGGVDIGNSLQVLAYVGSALGLVALPNTPAPGAGRRSRRGEGGHTSRQMVLIVLSAMSIGWLIGLSVAISWIFLISAAALTLPLLNLLRVAREEHHERR